MIQPAPVSVLSGDAFAVGVTWSATARPEVDYGVRLVLSKSSEAAAQEPVFRIATHPTSLWRAGDSYEAVYEVRTDPHLPAGTYSLTLALMAPGGPVAWEQQAPAFGIEIVHRDREFALPDTIEYPLDVRVGDSIRLRGFDLVSGLVDGAERQPGETVDIRLYWQAEGPTELSQTVFVQVIGPDGRAHGQVDRIPAGGSAPTTSWAAEQVIVDEVSVVIDGDAPAGDYVIVVGLYHAGSGDRLPITDSQATPSADRQVVLPVVFTVVSGEP
jgi:hypothetical protein